MPVSHALQRTSPFGEPFVGTCVHCGREGLRTSDLYGCAVPLSPDEVLMTAIDTPETARPAKERP